MPPESSSREPIPALSWEGDRMFNIYIYDYCYKRGFRKTARELMIEADLGNDATPPINARQGLLFEWWSVFWVLFQAKSGNSNHEDALLYTHHQSAQKAAQRMQAAPGQQQQPGVPIPLGNQPQPSSNPQSQPQAPGRGMPNGMPLQRQPSGYLANGAMPNGINPAMGGQPAQPGQMTQPMQGQGGTLNFGGIGGQPNGTAAVQQPPPQGGSQQPGTHSMAFNPMMGGPVTQRPPMNGQSQQPGQQQPRGPFTSPPMAHSPQGGAGGGQPTSQGQPGPPMAQLGPSPQMTPMSRSMLPPNGTHSASMTGPLNTHQGALPTNTFNPGQGLHGQGPPVRPRSRPTPSPSMSARQPPGAPQHQVGMGMMPMGPIQGMPVMGVMNLGGMGGGVGGLNPDLINHEITSIPTMALSNLKQEFGFGDKDLNIGDKAYIVTMWKQRSAGAAQQARVPGMPGSAPGMLPPGQPQAPQQGMQSQQRPQQSNRLKRNSTSPPEEQNEPRSESSPPDRKRVKRSPAQPPSVPPAYPQHHQPGQPTSAQPPAPTPQQTSMPLNPQPGQPGTPQAQMTQQQAHIMMMRQMGMQGASGPVPGGQAGQKPGGAAGGQTSTGPQPVGAPMHPSQMHHGLFRGGPPGPAAGRPSGVPQFHPTPLTQLATKPHIGMPVSSPGMNGPSKDGAKDIKRPQSNGQPQQGNQPVSPRNTGTAPPTPGASSQPTPGLPPTSLPPPPAATSGGSSAQNSAPQQSPGMPSMLGMPMNLPGMPGMNAGDFMFETTLMEDFDVFNKQEGDINFERDFGQWFNSTEDGTGLEMK